MAKGFNLTAEINLRGPSNVRQVVSGIRKQLTGINANVSVKISPQTAKNINTANKSFQNFNKTLKQTQSLAAATASSFSQLSNAAAQLSGNLKGVPSTIQQAAKATQTLSQTNTQAVGTVRQLSSEFAEFGKQSALAVRRFAAFATVTGAIYKVSNAINQASQDFVEFEQELVKVAQVSGSSIQNLNFLVQNVTRLSTTLGVASEDLISVSRTLAQAGLSAKDTSAALEALAKSALAPTFDDLNRTVEGSVALMRQFGISAAQLEGALGSINAVAGQFAVEAGDIITAISRTGGVFASASKGVSEGTDALNEFIAVFTSVRATTRESAETIATGLRTIFTRIQRTDTIDALKAYGVTLTDLEGKFVGPYKAVQLLAEGLGKIDPRDLKFSQIVEQLGGFRQIGKVIPLIQQFTTAQDALKAAQQGQGSLAKDAATAQQSLAVQIARVREEFTALIRSVGQSEGFRTFISLGLDLASAFIRVADAAKAALPAITALFAVKGLKALGQFGSGFLGGLKKNQGFNDGGYVHHFARGGVVPGSGNRDTVPAMLQPGEFVIRKKAVEQLGTQRLHKMNKFAIGGKVNDFAVSAAYTQIPEAQPTWDKAKGGPFVTTGETPNKFNPEDQFTYKKETKKVNVNRLSAPRSAKAREKYNTVRDTDPRARGFAFEEVLRDAGIVSSLAKRTKNAQGSARLDAKDSNGVAEIKSTQEIIDDANINAKMIGAALNPIGDTDQVIRNRFIKNAELNKGPNTFDLGTVTVYQDSTPVIGPDGKRTRLGRENKNNKNLGGYIQAFASGGSAEDTVPAMLTPGEFVINKQAASRIGSQKLHQLNNADRIQGYNKGGWVGFATGGGVEARGTELGTIGINPQDVAGLQALAKTISELGVIGSSTAKLLESGNQASYQSTLDALEADRLRAIAIGQSTDAIDENIAALTAQGEKAKKVAGALAGASGEQLQAIQTRFAQDAAYFRDPTTTADQVRDMAELDVDMSLGGGSELGKLVAAGEVDIQSIQDYIAQASRERKTLLEMDKRYRSEREAALRGVVDSDEEIKRIIDEEIAIRKKSVDQFAKTQGAKGPGDFGRRISEFSNKIGIGVSLFTSTLSSVLGEATTAAQAGMNAAIQSGGATFGAAQIASGAAIELLPDQLKGLGGVVGLVASGALAAGQALISAANAAREFRINEQFKKAETASEQVAEAFSKLEKDVDSIDVQTAIEDKLVQAGDALSRGLAIQQNEAKLFWANAIDVISSGGGRTGQEAAQRSQILERDGIVSYLRSFDDNFRESRMAATRGERSQASAAQFRPVADNINKLLEQRLGKGESVSDIFNDIDFDSFANSLARADQATNQRIQAILDDTSLSQAEKDARIKHISTIYAEEQVRQKAAVIARQKEIDALQASTTRYTKSLERMYTNMEQSINAAVASLNRMNSQIDTTIASLQGQAKIGDVILDAITVLQNPRAFGSAQVQSATSSAAGIFGSEASNIAGLINLGENIEASVFSSINRTLEQAAAAGESPSNARVLQDIDTGVQNTLDNLGLPPELADKLANEVRVALKDITKDAEGDFDFAEISEKIAGLGSVIESSARAREVAIKALEAYNTALNSYTQNLNKIIDIEISSRNYARKSLDILANSALDLSRALGESVSVNDIINKRNREIGRLTGGPTSPQDVFDQIQKLERDRVSQQATVDATAQTGLGGTDQFVEFNNKLKDTSIGLRENITALKSMADNTEVASAALNKIQEAQQRTAGQVGFLEKAVTSTPEELESMNRAFGRLQNNMNGQINTINNSIGAQKAYYEALQNGANQFQAMRAAQGAFAQERGESLSLLKDILPFLGDSEETGAIRANVLESMLRESGIGINPLMQQVLNSLRDPKADPAVAAAIEQYKQANNLQAKANELLGRLESKLAADISAKNEQAFRNALSNTIINFENSQLNDINLGIGQVIKNTAQTAQNTTPQNNQQNNQPNNPPPAPAFARGGVIYAQTGQEIFQPKGTDTVPAMLTPGEFVVNRKATQANLPLLKSINSGYYAAGGLVTSWHSNTIGESKRTTRKSYLDEDLLDSNLQNQYLVPALLTVANDSDPNFYPRNDNKRPNLSNLDASGKLAYGFMPTINMVKESRPDAGGGSTVYTFFKYGPAPDQGQDAPTQLQLFQGSSTKQIKEEDLDSYKDKLNKFKTNATNLKDDTTIENIYKDTYKSIPQTANATTSNDQYNPNITPTKAFLGLTKSGTSSTFIATNGDGLPVSENMPGYKIWNTPSTDWLPGFTDFRAESTISHKKPESFFSGDARSGNKVSHSNASIGNASYLNRQFDSILSGDDLKDLVYTHTDAYKAYQASLELLDPNFSDFRDAQKSETFKQLANLYNGISPFESFDDGRIFSKYSNIVKNTAGNLFTVVSDASLQQLIKKRGEIAAQQSQAGDKVDGFFGAARLLETDVTTGKLFDIKKPGDQRKEFAWVAGINPSELGDEFKEAQKKATQKAASDDGVVKMELLSPEKIKFKLPVAGENVDFETDAWYDKYTGQLYDPNTGDYDGQDFTRFLPKSSNDPFALFQNVKRDQADWLAFPDKKPDNVAPVAVNGAIQKRIDDYYNSINKQNPDGNNALKQALAQTTTYMDPSLIKYSASSNQLPRFISELAVGQDVRVGDMLVANVKKIAQAAGSEGEKIATPEGPFTAKDEQLDDSLFAKVTKKLTLGGLQLFSNRAFSNSRQFLGRNLGRIPRNDNIDTKEEAQQVAGFVSNIFQVVGGEASRLFNFARNPRYAQFLKENFILSSGASQAFSGINQGVTALINDFFRYAGNDFPLGAVEGLFRSLGGGQALEQAKNLRLPGGYADIFNNQLQGTKIAEIGPNGSIVYKPMTDAVPEDVRGLIDLIFNPYNAFPNTRARTNLIDKFQTDLNNLKGGGGLPYFDANTYGFINRGIDILEQWYGGAAGWSGQDFIFDKQANRDDNARAQQLATQFAGIGQLYQEAQAVNAAFGIKNKYGNLPNKEWFLARARAGADPQTLATGGIVYARTGGQMVNFQPQGTDTVPAMLTPGEFVVNRAATQKNLPLLKAINDGQSTGPYFANGGPVFTGPRVDVTDKSALDAEMQTLVNKLMKYASNKDKVMEYAARGLGVISTSVSSGDVKSVASNAYAYNESVGAKTETGQYENSKIVFSEQMTRAPTVRHEYAHAFAGGPQHDRVLTPLLSPSLLEEVEASDYQSLTGTGYTIDDYRLKPSELFATLASINGSIGPESDKFLKGAMPALGFNKGGVVYANKGMLIPYQPKGTDTVPAMLTPGEFVVNRQATQANLPLLKAINDGQSYSTGGVVYAATGKIIAPGVRSNFTNANGNTTIQAELISFDGETVKLLRLLDNKEFSVSIDKFDKPTIEALNLGRWRKPDGGTGDDVPPELMSMGTRRWTWTDPETGKTITRKAKAVSIDLAGFGRAGSTQLQMLDGPDKGKIISVPYSALTNESTFALDSMSSIMADNFFPVRESGKNFGPEFGPLTSSAGQYYSPTTSFMGVDQEEKYNIDERIEARDVRQEETHDRQMKLATSRGAAQRASIRQEKRKSRQASDLEAYKRYDNPEYIERLKTAGLTDERIAKLKSSAFARAGLRTEIEETNDRIDMMRRNGMSEAAINKYEQDRQVRIAEERYIEEQIDKGFTQDAARKEFRKGRREQQAVLQKAKEEQAMADLDISDDESVMKAFTVTGGDKGLEPGSNAWNQAYDKFKAEQIAKARKERIAEEQERRKTPEYQAEAEQARQDKIDREEKIAADARRKRDIEKYGLDAVKKRDQEREERRLAAAEKGKRNREEREARMAASAAKFEEEMDASNKQYEESRNAIRQRTEERQATIQNEPPAESYKERIARQRRELGIDDESFAKRRYTRYYSEDGKTRYPNGVTITAKDAAEAQKLQEEANEQRDRLDFVRAERAKIQARRKAEEDRKNSGAYVNMERSGNTFLQEAYQDLDILTGGAFGGFANSSLVRAGIETFDTGAEIGKGLFKKGAGLGLEATGTTLDLLNTASKSTIGVDIEKGLGVDARTLENKGRNLGDSGGNQLWSASERVSANLLALTEGAANLIPGVSIDSGVEDARNIADETLALSQRQEQRYLEGSTEFDKNVYGYSKEVAGVLGDPANLAGLAAAKNVGRGLMREATQQAADPAMLARFKRIDELRERAAKVGTKASAELNITNRQLPTLENALFDVKEGMFASADETLDIIESRIVSLEQSRAVTSGRYPAGSNNIDKAGIQRSLKPQISAEQTQMYNELIAAGRTPDEARLMVETSLGPSTSSPVKMQSGLSNPPPPKTPSQIRMEAGDSPYAGDNPMSDYMPTGSRGPTMSVDESRSTARDLRAQIDASVKITEPAKPARQTRQAQPKQIGRFETDRANKKAAAEANANASNRMIEGMSQSGREAAERTTASSLDDVLRTSRTPITGNQKMAEAVMARQEALPDVLSRYASSDEAVKRLKTDDVFAIDSVVAKKSADGTTQTSNSLASMAFDSKSGQRQLQFQKDAYKNSSFVDHELAHSFQVNANPQAMTRNADGILPYNTQITAEMGNDIEKFLAKGYPELLQSLGDQSKGMYQTAQIANNPVELFSSMTQAASTAPDIFNANSQAVEMMKKLMKFHGYEKGGVVYASKGMMIPYQPKGTDTVPAMLTPGEFVVNRAATQANLPLLKAINNGAQGYSNGGVAYRSKGGPIQYFNNGSTGGPVQVVSTQFTNSLESATRALTNFGVVVEQLKQAFKQNNNPPTSQNQQNSSGGVNIDMRGISQFTTKLQSLILQLENLSQIPTEIKMIGTHRVDVNILGAEAFQNLDPAIADLIKGEINNALALYNQQTFYV